MDKILSQLRELNIGIKVSNDKILLDVPKGVDVTLILEEIKSNKEKLILHLEKLQNIVERRSSSGYTFEKENFEKCIKENGRNYYDIFFQQERQYLRYKITERSNFNIVFTMKFENIEIPIIEKALTTVFRRHESLRTQYKFVNGEPMQYIVDEFTLPIVYYDSEKIGDKEIMLPKIFEKAMSKSCDFEAELPAFVTVINFSNKKSTLVFTMNHASSDYNSIAILKEEITALYEAYMAKKKNPLKELTTQYRHYTQWVNNMINSDRGIQMRDAYLAKIKASISGSISENYIGSSNNYRLGYKQQLQNELRDFSIDNQIEMEKRALGRIVNLIPPKGCKYSMSLDIKLFKQLEKVAIHYKVSPFIVLLSSFVLAFSKSYNKKHVRISVPFSTRVVKEFESMIGWLTSQVVLCLEVSPNISLEQCIKYIAKEFFAFSEYRFYPREEMLKDLDVCLDMLTPLYMNYIKYPNQKLNNVTEGHKKENFGHYSLGMIVSEYEDKVLIDIRYNLDIYSNEDIERFALMYKETLTEMVRNNSVLTVFR